MRGHPLPGLPGGGRGFCVLVGVLVTVIAFDRCALHGALFATGAWTLMRWAIVLIGVAIGGAAFGGIIR